MQEVEFQIWKGAAVALAFAVAVAPQWRLPLEHKPRLIIKNWRLNLPLAMLNTMALGTICGGCACTVSIYAQRHGLGLCNMVGVGALSGAIIGLFVLDLTAYAWHVANHRLAILWLFHSVHHSDEIFDASTAVRFHPGELLVSLVVRLIVVAVFGIPVIGVLAFEVISAFLNFFEHGNISLPHAVNRLMSRAFVTPQLHRFHHAGISEHLSTNFATIFSFWDRIFGTYATGTAGVGYKVGLPYPAPWTSTFMGVLKHPFLIARHPRS